MSEETKVVDAQFVEAFVEALRVRISELRAEVDLVDAKIKDLKIARAKKLDVINMLSRALRAEVGDSSESPRTRRVGIAEFVRDLLWSAHPNGLTNDEIMLRAEAQGITVTRACVIAIIHRERQRGGVKTINKRHFKFPD